MKYLLALICLCLPAYLIRFSVFGLPTTALEILIYLVFIFGLFNLKQAKFTKISFWWPIGFLLLAAAISVYVSPLKSAALGQFKAFFIDPLLVFWLMVAYLKKEDLSWLVGGLAGASFIVSGHAIYQKIAGVITADGRVIGLFGYSPNYLALFLAPIIGLLIAYGLQQKIKNKILVIGYWLLVFINISALWFSGSRGGLLALAGGIVFYLTVRYWPIISKRLWSKIAVGLIIVLAIASAAFIFRPNFNITTGRSATSNNVRWQIWTTSIEMVKNQPIFGVGLANFQNAFGQLTHDRGNFPEYITPEALTPHNIFLMFYLTTGLLGFTAIIWLLVVFYRTGLSQKDQISLIILTGMSVLILQGLVDAAYFKNDLSLIFWLLMGSILILKKE